MNRIETTFLELKNQHKKALIPYITAGDPNPDVTVPLLHALVSAGANIIELGVPFSDPMAEGPVIQAAHERALAHHVSLDSVLEMIADFRTQDMQTPIILMGYLNPIEFMGYKKFAEKAHHAGVDGLIIVDLPPEEANDLLTAMELYDIAPIFLLSPTTQNQRLKLISKQSKGYHYYVSVKGVTGANTIDIDAVKTKLQEVRTYSHLPIAVGFGIHDAKSAAAIAGIADGVIVGSAIVKKIGALKDAKLEILCTEIAQFVEELRHAID